jgi:1-acyl-sn-glycerol-3-phosphate acyltransferase
VFTFPRNIPVAAHVSHGEPGVIYVVRYALIVFHTVFWASVVCVRALFGRNGEGAVRATRNWARWILWTSRVRVEVEGLENIAPDRSYVVMSNHQSAFDIAAIGATLPLSWRFVAKRELTRIPIFGRGLVAAGHIVIDRADKESSIRTLRQAAERVRSGTSVVVFPEGTRSRTGELGPFKSGGFHLALEAGVPVLPATVSGSRRITPPRSLRILSGRILVRYGKPVPTETLAKDDRERLKAEVRQAILAGFEPALQD